jgi:hypothetical protein
MSFLQRALTLAIDGCLQHSLCCVTWCDASICCRPRGSGPRLPEKVRVPTRQNPMDPRPKHSSVGPARDLRQADVIVGACPDFNRGGQVRAPCRRRQRGCMALRATLESGGGVARVAVVAQGLEKRHCWIWYILIDKFMAQMQNQLLTERRSCRKAV